MKRRLLTCILASTLSFMGCSGDDDPGGGTGGTGGTGNTGGTATGGTSATGGTGATNTGGTSTGGEGGTGGTVSDVTQGEIDSLAASLEVTFTVIENIPMTTVDEEPVTDCPENAPGGLCADAKISLKNTGGEWNAGGWAIYYSGIRRVLSLESDEFTITHINGDLHKIEPTADFAGFGAGETKEIPIKVEFWMISETDVMPRFYVTAPDLMPKTIAQTDTEDLTAIVTPFTTPEQMKRHPDDLTVFATAGTRFTENEDVTDLGAAAVADVVIPTPAEVSEGTGNLDLSAGITINADGLSDASLDAVTARLTALGVEVVETGGVAVNVSVDDTNSAFDGKASAEAYTLEVDDTEVTIVGGDATGAFYGLQSLAALVPADFASTEEIPQTTIDYDAPRFGYRGVQVDLARNFQSPDTLMMVLDQMAAYKLNTLHLHLSDDEGWRLEIPDLPELTDVGAKRCHDLTETTCLIPQLGSGPTTETSATGHLTRDQFVALLSAATARHIEVIPEFDMPGHARAAIKAMEARAAGGDTTYLLSDPDDTSVYLSIQNYHDNAINGCLDSTYDFVAKVMDEVSEMYDDAGATLNTWHVGGDEVGAGAWSESPACDALFENSADVKSADDVHAYFIERVNKLAADRGFGLRGWSDGLRKTVVQDDTPTKVFLDPATDLEGNDVSTNWWGTLFWWDNSVYKMANAGYKVVLTSPDFLYLDHPYEADPKERGYYWATRFTNVRKLFSYMPGNLPANSQLTVDRMGADYTAVFESETAPVIALESPENIIGMEGALWGETVRTAAQLEYMVFPRLLALAERAWHRGDWEPTDGNDHEATIGDLVSDWESFANVLGYKELPKLDTQGIRYRVAVPGARIEGGNLEANVAFPGLVIEYLDGEDNWVEYDSGNPPEIASTQVRAKASDGRVGRAVPVE